MNSCTGQCSHFKNIRRSWRTSYVDEDGSQWKHCRGCKYFMITDNVFCTCCRRKLAIRPRNGKDRHKVMAKLQVKYL